MSVEIRDLEFAYPGATSGLLLPELSVPDGGRLAVIGPSGSGKTTLLNLLSGLIAPDAGTLWVNGTALHTLSRRQTQLWRARTVGHIFQDFGLLDYLSARDNILHPFRITRGRKVSAEARARVAQLAADLGVAHRLDHRPARLSHGERQRVAICRAVATDPGIILADEPTGNLDPETAGRIMDHLLRLQDRLGATLVMVTHDPAMLPRFERILDIRDLPGVAA